MRVVLIEDNPAMQSELRRAVSLIDGAQVVMTSATAQAAIAWLDANPQGWDLAIVDTFLQTGHGFEVLKHCQKTLPHQRMVMLSNYGRDQVGRYAEAAGADRFFDKSFDMDALWSYIKSVSREVQPGTQDCGSTALRLHYTVDLTYEISGPSADFIFNVEAAHTPCQRVVTENLSLSTGCTVHAHTPTGTGMRILNVNVFEAAHPLTLHYEAEIEIAHIVAEPAAISHTPINRLPPAVLGYLYPSRYCQSDQLLRFANAEFGEIEPAYARAQSICDWVGRHIQFASNTTSGITSACDTLIQKQGVCRDFAHLMIALCRAVNLPARMATGIDFGADPALGPQDFHAYVEVYLGNRWWIFDPSQTAIPMGFPRIGTGRDAADVAFCTIFGPATMTSMTIGISALPGLDGSIREPRRIEAALSSAMD